MSDVKSKIKFRHQAFAHVAPYLYPMLFQNSSFCLNIDTVDTETTISGKEFHMLINLCVKRFLSIEA